MPDLSTSPSRTKTVGVSVTEKEHETITKLARLRERSVSDLLRDKPVAELMAEWEKVQKLLDR